MSMAAASVVDADELAELLPLLDKITAAVRAAQS